MIPVASASPVICLTQVYWKGQHEKFLEGGKMSQHLELLAVGDTIEVKLLLTHQPPTAARHKPQAARHKRRFSLPARAPPLACYPAVRMRAICVQERLVEFHLSFIAAEL